MLNFSETSPKGLVSELSDRFGHKHDFRGNKPMNYLRALAIIALLYVTPKAQAFELDPNEIRGKSSKEPVTVLQNRYFLKSFRPEFGLTAGTLLDEAYLKTTVTGVRAGLFFTEWVGFEVQGLKTSIQDSDDRKALNSLKYRPLEDTQAGNATPSGTTTETIVTPDPEVNAVHGMTDGHVIAAPLYGKLNILNKWIVYTDLYVAAGVSRVVTDQGAKGAFTMGAGERFYVGQSWSFRFDFKDRIYTETRAGVATRKHSKSVDIGAGYFFN